MDIGKIVGGILALFAGVLVLCAFFYYLFVGPIPITYPPMYINLIISAVTIVGGILMLLGKKIGGIFALVAGLVWVIMGLITATEITYQLVPLSFIFIITDIASFYNFSIHVVYFRAFGHGTSVGHELQKTINRILSMP